MGALEKRIVSFFVEDIYTSLSHYSPQKILVQSPLLTGFVLREPGDATSPGTSVVLSAPQIVMFYRHYG